MTEKEKLDLCSKIADRGVRLLGWDKATIFMDISSVKDGLDLNGLLNADDFNFAHDVMGINQNLDHDTKKLNGKFVPRYEKI